MGLPPILKYGSSELKNKIVEPILKGQKTMSLTITEPWAGSDVSAI